MLFRPPARIFFCVRDSGNQTKHHGTDFPTHTPTRTHSREDQHPLCSHSLTPSCRQQHSLCVASHLPESHGLCVKDIRTHESKRFQKSSLFVLFCFLQKKMVFRREKYSVLYFLFFVLVKISSSLSK